MATEAAKRARNKWNGKNATVRTVTFYAGKDDDILAHLDAQESKQAYVKGLIREDMAKTLQNLTRGSDILYEAKRDEEDEMGGRGSASATSQSSFAENLVSQQATKVDKIFAAVYAGADVRYARSPFRGAGAKPVKVSGVSDVYSISEAEFQKVRGLFTTFSEDDGSHKLMLNARDTALTAVVGKQKSAKAKIEKAVEFGAAVRVDASRSVTRAGMVKVTTVRGVPGVDELTTSQLRSINFDAMGFEHRVKRAGDNWTDVYERKAMV